MSGRNGDTTTARAQPIPEDDGMAPRNTPELIRQLMDRIDVLEQLASGTSTNLAGLQQAQTTVQQSVNLIQAAHNNLHDQINATAAPSSSYGGAATEVSSGRQQTDDSA